MIRRLVAQLHDELAEIGFDDFEAGRLQRSFRWISSAVMLLDLMTSRAFFPCENAEDDRARLFARRWPNGLWRRALRAWRRIPPDTVEVIDGLPFVSCRELSRAWPVLKRHFALVADGLVFAQRRLDDRSDGANPARLAGHRESNCGGRRAHDRASISAR